MCAEKKNYELFYGQLGKFFLWFMVLLAHNSLSELLRNAKNSCGKVKQFFFRGQNKFIFNLSSPSHRLRILQNIFQLQKYPTSERIYSENILSSGFQFADS
jgi:hypothetical protein